MEFTLILIKQIIIMFLMMSVGYLLYKKGKITNQGSKEIGNILIHIVIPCVVINSYMTELDDEHLSGLLLAFILSVFTLIISIVISHIIFKKHPIEDFGSAFSNAGFMGIPIIQMLLGSDAVFYVSTYVAMINVFQWTYGVYLMTHDKRNISIYKIVTNPVLISMLIGFVLFILPIDLPEVLCQTLDYFANLNAPLAMISLGTYLAQTSFSIIIKDKVAWSSSFVRLILIPLISLCILKFIPNDLYLIKMTVLIAASTPVGSNVAIFAQLNGQDYTQAIKSICLSTVCSLITMPFIITLAMMIW